MKCEGTPEATRDGIECHVRKNSQNEQCKQAATTSSSSVDYWVAIPEAKGGNHTGLYDSRGCVGRIVAWTVAGSRSTV